MALYFECQIHIYALLQTVFLAILPTGLVILINNAERGLFRSEYKQSVKFRVEVCVF